MNKQQGFTLIELVVVIIILGILAVTAAPKFIDLQSDARLATLQGMKAALQSASTLIRSKAAVQQIERLGAGCLLLSGTATTSCTGDGEVNLAFGYPLATARDLGISVALDFSAPEAEWQFTSQAGEGVITPRGTSAVSAAAAADPANRACQVRYQQAVNGNVRPRVTLEGAGC